MNDSVFDEELDDFDDELEDFDDEEDTAPVTNAVNNTSSPFSAVEEKPQTDTAKGDTKSVFEPVISDAEINRRVALRNEAWKAAASNKASTSADSALAQGLPDWDLAPPEMLVRRRSMK